jgi:ribokinase
VALIGCVGRDANGAAMLDNLRSRKVETKFIEEHPSVPTGVAFIFIDEKAENMIGIAAGANDEVYPARLDLLREELRRANVVIIQNEVPAQTVRHLFVLAQEDSLRVLYNCAPAREIHGRLLAGVEWLVLNESEAASISGHPVTNRTEAKQTAQILLEFGVKHVLLTLGVDGVCVASQGGASFHVPAFPVTAVDTVGAGDTFCGAFATACGEGQALANAVRFASAAAALSVMRAGAQNASPTRGEIEAFLQTFTT